MLSVGASRALRRIGWSESRYIDVKNVLREGECEGYSLFPAAAGFLQSFLDFKFNSKNGWPVEFNAILVMQIVDRERVVQYETILQCPLFPVGSCGAGNLYISSENQIYCATDQWLMRYGKSVERAIDNMLEDVWVDCEEIPWPESMP